MAEQASQNYSNHVRIPPPIFMGAFLVVTAYFLWSIYATVKNFGVGSVLFLLFLAAVIILFFYARMFALAVQDRLIRLEERLRLERLLPAELRPRIGEFTVKQLIALRFAGDAELPALAAQVLNGQLTEPDAIKRAVKEWRADWQRA